ncbi:MAG: hypothetical protein U9N38_05160, partial [Thermodesulfobacteriota bacterium]|nr:hypothetical protein [Thermodesulfobacteriota bacterium]
MKYDLIKVLKSFINFISGKKEQQPVAEKETTPAVKKTRRASEKRTRKGTGTGPVEKEKKRILFRELGLPLPILRAIEK